MCCGCMKIPYFIPWISREDKNSVLRALTQRWLTNGPILQKFEQRFREYTRSKYSLGVSNATHALHLCLKSLGIDPSDEVIVPTFTFAATANAVIYCGAKPVLTDVDLKTYNILPSEIKRKRTKRTKAVIVVHYGGQSCDMDDIMTLSEKYGLYVLEDCAHALGSTYQDKKCGNIGHAGCFSFYPTKIITTGEGGMITTNSFKVFRNSKLLRTHGIDKGPNKRERIGRWRYDVQQVGYNYRLDEMRAALGLSQLKRINEINDRRIKIAGKYNKKLENVKGITIPYKKNDRNHIYHLYTIQIEDEYHLTRNQIYQNLHRLGIGASVQYYPLHLMSYKKKEYQNKINEFPNANILKDRVLSLPIFPTMTSKQIDIVASALNS